MIPLSEVTVLDRNSKHMGVAALTLMENAGGAAARILLSDMNAGGKRVLIICGPGNNGGDGFVCARRLSRDCAVTVLLIKPWQDIKTGISLKNYGRLAHPVKIVEGPKNLERILEWTDIVVDSLLGSGLSGSLREPYRKIIETINAWDGEVVSMDLPSGFGTDTPIVPDMTVTFHELKEGMNEETCGKVVVADIGIPEDAKKYVGPGEFAHYPVPGASSHKGDCGKLLVIGGGPYTGAPSLSALGAYRCGVDLAKLVVPERIFRITASFSPAFIVEALPGEILTQEHVPGIVKIARDWNAVLIGPGLGRDSKTLEAVRELVTTLDKPFVVDADALHALPSILPVTDRLILVTPHRGEFAALFGESVPEDLNVQMELVKRKAAESGLTVLLKGEMDVISDGSRTKLNRTGNPGMTVGGTGDVLAGVCGGLMAKGVAPFDAGRLAAFISGSAGDVAFDKMCYGMMAVDVAEAVPEVLKKWL